MPAGTVFTLIGEITSTTASMSGVTRTLSYQYDALSDVTQLTRPIQASWTNSSTTSLRRHDPHGGRRQDVDWALK